MRNILIFGLLGLIAIGCNQKEKKEKESRLEAIRILEKKDSSSRTGLIKDRIVLWKSYYESYPDDSLSSMFLFKTAKGEMELGNFDRASNYLETYLLKYPGGKEKADVLFILGFLYDGRLNKKEEARRIYKSFISEFPQDPLVRDVKIALELLDYNDEELIQKLENQNKPE